MQAIVTSLLRNPSVSDLSAPSEEPECPSEHESPMSLGSGDPAFGVIDPNMSQNTAMISRLCSSVIGRGLEIETAFGRRFVTHAEHSQSGRFLEPIEDFMRDSVCPWNSNAAAESSNTARVTGQLLRAAQESVATFIGISEADFHINFVSPSVGGATGALLEMLEVPRRPPLGKGGASRLTAPAPCRRQVTVIISAIELATLEPVIAGWQAELVVRSLSPLPACLRYFLWFIVLSTH
jgi:hypothetical protein